MGYEDLSEEERRILRDTLDVSRVSSYYLEDHNIVLLNRKEMLDYVFIDEIEKKSVAISYIKELYDTELKTEDANKTLGEILLERHDNVIKLSSNAYAYRN